jgi:hypothetical protein
VVNHQRGPISSHDRGGVVTITGGSTGTFAFAGLPSEFSHGQYRERYTILSLANGGPVQHAHSVALMTFARKAAGSACILINGPQNLATSQLMVKFQVLGGTGDGAKIRLSGSAHANIGTNGPVQVYGHGALVLGKPRPLPAECRHLS